MYNCSVQAKFISQIGLWTRKVFFPFTEKDLPYCDFALENDDDTWQRGGRCFPSFMLFREQKYSNPQPEMLNG